MLKQGSSVNFIWKEKAFDKYLLLKYAALFFVLAFHLFVPFDFFSAPSPFAVGLFMGLSYSGVSLSFLFPVFALATVAFTRNLSAVVCVFLCEIPLTISWALHKKTDKSLSLLEMNLVNLVSSAVTSFVFCSDVYLAVAYVACQTLYSNAVFICFNRLLHRKTFFSTSPDEKLAVATVYLVTFLGLYGIDVFSLQPYYILVPFSLMFFIDVFGLETSLVAASLSGLGIFFLTGNFGYMATYVVCVFVAAVFLKTGVFLSSLSFALTYVFFCIYSPFADTPSYLAILFTFCGALFYSLVPKKYRAGIKDRFSEPQSPDQRDIFYLSGKKLSAKLGACSDAFFRMSRSVFARIKEVEKEETVIKNICKTLESELCSNCVKYGYCKRAAAGSLMKEFFSMAEGAYKRGIPYTDEISSFLTGNCDNLNKAIGFSTQIAGNLKKISVQSKTLARAKIVVAEQAKETSLLLQSMAKAYSEEIFFDENAEETLNMFLNKKGIVGSRVICYNDKENILHVHVFLRPRYADDPGLEDIVSKALGQRVVESTDGKQSYNGFVFREFVSAPNFELLYSCKVFSATAEVSGDTKTVKKIDVDTVLLALSDGMGRGSKAGETGESATALLESFFAAGFSPDKAAYLANKIMAMNEEDVFSATDLGLTNLRTGEISFIKMGSPPSFLLSGNKIEKIENQSLPFGIVGSLKVNAVKKRIKNKDVVLWVSDGVYDRLGEERICRLMMENKGLNPEKISEAISSALLPCVGDDASCVCVRFLQRQK